MICSTKSQVSLLVLGQTNIAKTVVFKRLKTSKSKLPNYFQLANQRYFIRLLWYKSQQRFINYLLAQLGAVAVQFIVSTQFPNQSLIFKKIDLQSQGFRKSLKVREKSRHADPSFTVRSTRYNYYCCKYLSMTDSFGTSLKFLSNCRLSRY